MSLIGCSKNPFYSPYLKNLKDKPSLGSDNCLEVELRRSGSEASLDYIVRAFLIKPK